MQIVVHESECGRVLTDLFQNISTASFAKIQMLREKDIRVNEKSSRGIGWRPVTRFIFCMSGALIDDHVHGDLCSVKNRL